MTLSRINHLGAAPTTGLASSITAVSTSLTLNSGSGYPTANFVIKVDAGAASEEKILVGSRSGTTCSSLTRGYDGTVAASHSAAAGNVEHDCAAVVIDDANDHIYTTSRDDHTQYALTNGTRAITGAQTFSAGLTVTTGGLTVSAGGAAVTGNSKVTGTLETTAALTVDAGGLTVSAGGATVTGNSTVSGTLTATSFTATADDAAWTAISVFANGWVNYGAPYATAAYRKVNGRVYLRGEIKSGTVGSVAFTLPSGYRPANSEIFACASNSAFGQFSIDSSGNVTPNVGSNVGFSLEGSFDTI